MLAESLQHVQTLCVQHWGCFTCAQYRLDHIRFQSSDIVKILFEEVQLVPLNLKQWLDVLNQLEINTHSYCFNPSSTLTLRYCLRVCAPNLLCECASEFSDLTYCRHLTSHQTWRKVWLATVQVWEGSSHICPVWVCWHMTNWKKKSFFPFELHQFC